MGYENDGTFVFRKNKFSKQWKFLIHTILHCLSSKHSSWDQFGSKEAMALICLSKGQIFNWSKAIFEAMVRNVTPCSKKFLMYPRFLQMVFDEDTTPFAEHTYTLLVGILKPKVFSNMNRGPQVLDVPLTPVMLLEGEGQANPAVSQPTPSVSLPIPPPPMPSTQSLPTLSSFPSTVIPPLPPNFTQLPQSITTTSTTEPVTTPTLNEATTLTVETSSRVESRMTLLELTDLVLVLQGKVAGLETELSQVKAANA